MAKKSIFRSANYLEKARQEITAWEQAKRNYWARLGDMVFDPAAKFTAKAVPKSVQKSVTQVIAQCLRMMAQAGEFSVDFKAIDRERSKRLRSKRALGSRLAASDALAKRFWTTHCGFAAAHGAASGVIGLPGLVADIPLLLSVAIREIRTIGLCYGYRTTQPEETEYVLHILRLGSSSEEAAKIKSLRALKKLEQSLFKNAQATSSQLQQSQRSSKVRYLLSIEDYAKSLALELVQRRALQFVPMAGIVTAASFNAAYANDVGKAAYFSYRRRLLSDSQRSKDE